MTPMPKEVKNWLLKNFEDCENMKLTQDERIKFFEFIDNYKRSEYLQEAFNHYQKTKLI